MLNQYRIVVLSGLLLSAMLPCMARVPAQVYAQTGGSSPIAASACQQRGYLQLQRTDRTRFTTADECASYAAQGGQLLPVPRIIASYVAVPAASMIGLSVSGAHFAPTSVVKVTVVLAGFPSVAPTISPLGFATDATGGFALSSSLFCRLGETLTQVTVTATDTAGNTDAAVVNVPPVVGC